ncbi:putative NADP(+)-dependent dehydrogenase [Ophiobolus disseminans]|uniref:Putative NADP(+)-dependent dehydrogenase n=1 Tax=Ophiobolus disseminans TaxID=1469910 RepID=A0A6A6ZLM6_9PLEO|nr:putative NADP(+)-dependent dehydrogenase [Ophiobolus disseminans]
MTNKPPYPSLTPTWRNDIYPAIDYSNPCLNQAGNTIIITGAGSGIGRETALGFATAGAAHLVLIGRTEASLKEVKTAITAIYTNTKVSVHPADVTDDFVIKEIASAVGTWDAILHCAAHFNAPSPAATADIDDYWRAYEVNLKSLLILAKHFLPTANPTHSAFLAYTGGAIVMPTQMLVGMSGYLVSKMALAKTVEFLALENPHVVFIAYHPGMVDTKIFRKSGAEPEGLPMDTARLSAGCAIWATLPEARFLSGKVVWANWDVEEMKGMKDGIADKLTFVLQGWPFGNVG